MKTINLVERIEDKKTLKELPDASLATIYYYFLDMVHRDWKRAKRQLGELREKEPALYIELLTHTEIEHVIIGHISNKMTEEIKLKKL